MKSFRKISAQETHSVRHPMLREGKPIESCRFAGDEDPGTNHYGMFVDGELIGVVTSVLQINTVFDRPNQTRLRGMAVLKSFGNQGMGTELLNYCENDLKDAKCGLIWFNARIRAVNFYERSGYKKTGDAFDMPGIGLHYIMYKQIMTE